MKDSYKLVFVNGEELKLMLDLVGEGICRCERVTDELCTLIRLFTTLEKELNELESEIIARTTETENI